MGTTINGNRPALAGLERAKLAAGGLALATLIPVTSGCGASQGGPATAGVMGARDTEIVHEACDGSSSSAKSVDVNGDQRPDIVHVHDGGREVCRIVDLNLDGAIDAYVYYDAQGKERRRESDYDRDGRPDEIILMTAGVVTQKHRETNFDNRLDTWDFYESGRIVRRERDSDGDGIIDQWWDFNNPQNAKCAVVTADRDGDARPDPGSEVDLCEDQNVATAPPPPAQDAPDPAAAGPSPEAEGDGAKSGDDGGPSGEDAEAPGAEVDGGSQ